MSIAGGEVTVVYAYEQPPPDWVAAVFLAGPTPRSEQVASWRPDALVELRRQWRQPGRLVVFNPEPRDGRWTESYDSQIGWETAMLDRADEVVFWVPRDLATMPAFTTNVEFGMACDSGRVVFGAPPAAPKNRYLVHHAQRCRVPVAGTLPETIAAALKRIGTGAPRRAGERDVPLLVWRLPGFQAWYGAQQQAGNTLLAARLGWTLRTGSERDTVLYWALHARLRIGAEDREKEEVVLARPDLAVVALYHRPPGGTADDLELVLVREVRVPAVTPDGYIHELPGGGIPYGADPRRQAATEVAEETGFAVDPDRLRYHGRRQLVGTMSAHHAYLYSAELSTADMELLREAAGRPHGNAGDGERTFVEIVRYARLRENPVDWATLGMVEVVVADLPGSTR